MISVQTAARLFCLLAIFFLPAQAVTSKEDCPSSYFKCGDGTCVSFLSLCDGEANKFTAKTAVFRRSKREQPKPSAACNGHYECEDGTCVRFYLVCDILKRVREKESKRARNCLVNESRCDPEDLQSKCISKSLFCDGKSDCPNGFDESQCYSANLNLL